MVVFPLPLLEAKRDFSLIFTHMIISLEVEKAFDKLQHPFMSKKNTFCKVGIERNCLNLIKNIYKTPTANIIFFLRFFFLMWTIFKVFIEIVTILLLFYVRFFGHKACGILAPQPGIEPAPPALEGEILTAGPPGKSITSYLMMSN